MPPKCQRCRGGGMLEADLKDLGTLDYVTHVIGCPDCMSKGVRDESNSSPERAYASVPLRNERAHRPTY